MLRAALPRAVIEQRSKTRDLLTELLKRAQQHGDLAPSEDPAALARYLLMVFNGLALQAAEGMPEAELSASAERALTAWPARPRRAAAKRQPAAAH